MDAFKKLRRIFPEANEETRLILLSPSTRIRIGKHPIHLAAYSVDEGQIVHAAYSPERNEIYLRMTDFENPFLNPVKSQEKNKEKKERN